MVVEVSSPLLLLLSTSSRGAASLRRRREKMSRHTAPSMVGGGEAGNVVEGIDDAEDAAVVRVGLLRGRHRLESPRACWAGAGEHSCDQGTDALG